MQEKIPTVIVAVATAPSTEMATLIQAWSLRRSRAMSEWARRLRTLTPAERASLLSDLRSTVAWASDLIETIEGDD